MKVSEKYTLEIGAIQNDIDELLKGQYSNNLANRLNRNFNELIKMIDNNKQSGAEIVAEKYGSVE